MNEKDQDHLDPEERAALECAKRLQALTEVEAEGAKKAKGPKKVDA